MTKPFTKWSLAILISSFAFISPLQASNERMYEVKITNLTKGILFTPFLAATHNTDVRLYGLGRPASEALARVAEGGDTSLLQAELDASADVSATATVDAPLAPGESVTLQISAHPRFKRLSLAAMLLPTNDGLVVLRNRPLPKGKDKNEYYFIRALDGGSETNDELCNNIPGPQCGGAPFSPDDAGEGYVYPHPGIHGEGDLSTSAYQWQDPVARVRVKRIH